MLQSISVPDPQTTNVHHDAAWGNIGSARSNCMLLDHKAHAVLLCIVVRLSPIYQIDQQHFTRRQHKNMSINTVIFFMGVNFIHINWNILNTLMLLMNTLRPTPYCVTFNAIFLLKQAINQGWHWNSSLHPTSTIALYLHRLMFFSSVPYVTKMNTYNCGIFLRYISSTVMTEGQTRKLSKKPPPPPPHKGNMSLWLDLWLFLSYTVWLCTYFSATKF